MEILNEGFRCGVAEGPLWDERSGRVIFVDIPGECVYFADIKTKEIKKLDIGQQVGCVALCENGDLLAAAEDGVYRINARGEKILAHRPIKIKGSRFNDGKVGPDGCFYLGTTDDRSNGAFYVLRDGELCELFGGCACSNGLDWSADGKYMFYCDTPRQKIELFDFDAKNHSLSNRRDFVAIEPSLGCPDGFCTDENDNIYLALWNGGALLKIDRGEEIKEKIEFPARKVSCCCFAGEGLCDLIVTTASKEDAADYPLSGYVFKTAVGAKGKKPFRYIY